MSVITSRRRVTARLEDWAVGACLDGRGGGGGVLVGWRGRLDAEEGDEEGCLRLRVSRVDWTRARVPNVRLEALLGVGERDVEFEEDWEGQ